MKVAFLSLVLSLNLVPVAMADGFICSADQSGIKIRVYNHVNPSEGTRSPAVFILSDPHLKADKQTLATFSGDLQNLQYGGNGLYTALLSNATYAKNGMVAGNKLSDLSSIQLAIVFSYTTDSTTLADSVAQIPATIRYQKTNGSVASEDATCTRYLKDPKVSLSTN